MAINRKGLRPIIVEGREYLWRFGADIVCIYQESPFGEIRIDYGYIPVVDDMGDMDRLRKQPRFDSNMMTPKYIRRAILFAKSKNWQKGKICLIYRDGHFMDS